MYEPIASLDLQSRGINASAPRLSPRSQAALSDGSWNTIIAGDGYVRPVRKPTAQGANSGSRKMLTIGRTWGGIKDNGMTQAAGSFFEDIGRSRWGIGAGLPHIEGVNLSGWTLTTNLKLQIAAGGVYGSVLTAGIGQPSAPEVGVIQTTGDISNSVSVKIEGTRPATGGRSLASPTSAVVVPQANRLRVTFPAIPTGATHWRVYITFQGFGGTGVHYLALYSGLSDIPEATVAAGTVGGVARSLEFNYKDGDLVPIEASYDDYPPPAATHALRLQSVLNLIGCYADSTAAPTSTSTGVGIAVSKQNNYESYIPTHLLFLPEPVVDVLSRPIDDYGYIACENSIHALQYIGDRGDELPPCTITTILPDIGIKYQHNWCHFRGRLLIYTVQGNLLLMDENGNFDTEFAGPVTKILQAFDAQNTVVGYDPTNDAIVVGNGNRILTYSLQAGEWRQVWLNDLGAAGSILSAVQAKRELFFSMNSGGSDTAYLWDDDATFETPFSVATNYLNAPGGNSTAKDIYELAVSAESGAASPRFAIAVSRNMMKSVFRRITITMGSDTITDVESGFDVGMVGKRVLIFSDDIENPGDVLFHGLVGVVNSSASMDIRRLDNITAFNPAKNATDVLMFIGDWSVEQAFNKEHIPNFFPNLADLRSYRVAMWMKGSDDIGNVLSTDIIGAAYSAGRSR